MADNMENGWDLNFKRDERIHPVTYLKEVSGIPFITFPKLLACDKIEHIFTTRAGGVSEGQFRSMNFSVNLGDLRENVSENYRRIAKVLHAEQGDIVGTVQTHTVNIRRVTAKDKGKVAVRVPDYGDVDGLVTNEKGIVLAAFTADCVPIYFVDPVKEAIGLAHSGWRGTACNMAGKMVERMKLEFGTDPSDLIVAIGPSICQKCYEVDQTVADHFWALLGEATDERKLIRESGTYPMEGKDGLRRYLEDGRETGKYQLDLWLVNQILLVREGIMPEQVDVTDLCTAENAGILFSHRASKGKRGNMGAFLKLKSE